MEDGFHSDSCCRFNLRVTDVVPAIENAQEIVEEEEFGSEFGGSEDAMGLNLKDSSRSHIRITKFDTAVEKEQEIVVSESDFVSKSDNGGSKIVKCLYESGNINEVFSELKEMQEFEENKLGFVSGSVEKAKQEIEENKSISIFASERDNSLKMIDSCASTSKIKSLIKEENELGEHMEFISEIQGSNDSLGTDERAGNLTVIEKKQSVVQDHISSSRTSEENSESLLGVEENQLQSTPEVEVSNIKDNLEIPSEIKEKHKTAGIEAQITGNNWSSKDRQEIVENDRKEMNCFVKNGEHVGNSSQSIGKQEMPAIQFHLASVSKKETDCEKKDPGFVNSGKEFSEIIDKTNLKQEFVGKNDNYSKRRAKKVKKVAELDENKNVLCLLGEARNVCQKKGRGIKIIYSRNELEALRFVNADEQQKLWNDIYLGLGPAAARELDDMADTKNLKQGRRNVDHRQRRGNKKESGPILSEVCSEHMENNFEELKPLDITYDHHVNREDGYTAVEGESIEDEDSDDEYESIQRPAFIIAGEPNFESGPPQDGLEYLRRVRWEAAHIPKVKVAKLDRRKLNSKQTVYMLKIPDIPKCPEHLLPLKQWEDAFLVEFSELRLALSRLESLGPNNADNLRSLLAVHGDDSFQPLEPCSTPKDSNKVPSVSCMDEDDSFQLVKSCSLESSNNMELLSGIDQDDYSQHSDNPTLSAILGMDYVARASMLRRRISSLETESVLCRNGCLWLYALCVAVDTPLDADTSASLRRLLRKCASLRAMKSECDDEGVMLNILVTISGRYFGQSEN